MTSKTGRCLCGAVRYAFTGGIFRNPRVGWPTMIDDLPKHEDEQ